MTVRLYHYIIGNAWGLPPWMEGAEHYWCRLIGEQRGKWKSACGKHIIKTIDEFSGVPSISLSFEHNPAKWSRCRECVLIYGETDYGKKHGIKPPFVDASKNDPRR